ncbi:surfactin exporter involved in surfactin self-resistance [Exiguobacterium sp. 8H]|uniref:efflux RND transporter permease subunit n=1 Tax=unclassified Exiguobacterium TaxID=2644629 RepID=UPI0012F243E2|nr:MULTISPECIES: efflux RND transporter permease subunit [unclassified Exiguobacterium]MBG0918869.1 efflux RND transporter permease subunit [Exiguobacterium sp. SRB7LM]VXB93380.1 surfactin exporter involved in surfactin self-resistance [Exiguobacterium sp. 8H]VXC13518.1 surfactin exporter involved in surfactin self-resistance [Exiguobacterium sp. 8A]
MQKITSFSVNNKFAVWLMTIILTAAGLFAGLTMKLETLPDITTPTVSVTTIYPGASPEQVLEEVSTVLEDRLQNLNGVEQVRSSSFQNASNIQIDYDFSTDMDEAEQQVKDALSNVELPESAQEPQVSRLSFDAFPVIGAAISDESLDLAELTKLVEEEVQPALEGVEGAQTVQIAGQEIRRVELQFDQEALAEYNLTEDTVKQLIQANDARIALGLYELGDTEQAVVIDGKSETLEAFRDIQIPYSPAQSTPTTPSAPTELPPSQTPDVPTEVPTETPSALPPNVPTTVPTVALSELATIEDKGIEESISRSNGERSIGVQVTKTQDANTVDVVNAVKEVLNDFEAENDTANVSITLDQGQPIEESVETMLSKALLGGLFAILIILVFLRNFRSTIIAVISIPLSLLMALIVLKQLDITLNIMTLGAMTVAIGRVVDDSIVVIENIYRRLTRSNEPLRGKELIIAATKEVFIPIASSTIVTIAVFLPLGFVTGFVGELFLPFALTVVFALLASLLVAITVVPMMADSFFKNRDKLKPEEGPGKLAEWYRGVLNWSLNHKLVVFGLATALLIGSFALVPAIGVNFLNQDSEKTLFVTFDPEPGQTLEDSIAAAEVAEEYFMEEQPNATDVQFTVGGENPLNPGNNKQGIFIVQYDPDTEDFADVKLADIEKLNELASNGEWKEQDFSGGGATSGVTYNVYANSLEDLEAIVPTFIETIEEETDYVRQATSDLRESYVQYTFNVDQQAAAEAGVSAGQIAQVISQFQAPESPLASVTVDDKQLDVVIPNEQVTYDSVDDLQAQEITTPFGPRPISDFIEIEEGTTPDTLVERDGKLLAQVSVELSTDKATEASAAIEERVSDIELPSGVSYDVGGVTEQIQESFTQLGLAMLAAIAIVYLVLVITFGGALTPFVVLFSLPYAIIGGLVALLITGETISVSALIGALMLIGIVVTNAIVLIDRVIHKEEAGLSTREALLEAAGTRLRPILMTALATIGALAPLALGLEGGALISKGLGVTVIGGLTSSTLLTLLIVPIVYEFFARFRKKKQA